MNTQAAIKTLLVVLCAGALAGYFDWKEVYGRTPAERAARDLASCIAAGKAAEYRKNPLTMGRAVEASNKQIEAQCRDDQLANSTGPAYGPAGQTAPTPAPPPKMMTGQPKRAHQATHQAEAKPARDQAAAPTLTSKLDQCLERIEEARKRSPGGLNPEWEQGERDRCKAL